MTKVECPGPGFKGLKWKWIQDHAKEQQERERERLAVHQVQVPTPSGQPSCPQPQPGPKSSSELPQTVDTCVQHEKTSCQSGGSLGPSVKGAGDIWQSPAGVKVEPPNGLSGSAPGPLTGGFHGLHPEPRVRAKEEQGITASRASEPPARCVALPSAPSPLDAVAAQSLNAAALAVGADGPTGATTVVSAGAPQTGVGVSPSPTMPAAGIAGRKSVDPVGPIPPMLASMSPTAAVSPTAPAFGTGEGTHAAGSAAGAGFSQTSAQPAAAAAVATAATASSCILTPAAVPCPALTSTVAPTQPSAVPAAQPPAAPSAAPLLGTGAARVRLPPARAPSMTVASVPVKGGDDFESMFTPLSSLPSAKSDTPRAGMASRSGSALPGPQAGVPAASAAAGSGAPATAAMVAHDGGQAADRKGHPKKASRVQDGRSSGGQPSAAIGGAAGTVSEPADVDHVTAVRGRTPVTQIIPVAAGAGAGSAREAHAGAAAPGGPPAATSAGKAQSQGQGHLAPQQPSLATQMQPQPLQQRTSGGKQAKDGSKLRDTTEGNGAAATAAQAGAAVAGPTAPAGGGPLPAGNRVGDRSGAPASAGSTPAAAPAHSGEPNAQKRPRSEGSKAKAAGASLTVDPHGTTESAWPYGETLADRIKRAKRATTSSSDQDGPYSHGGSADRLVGAHAAHVGNAAGGVDGHANAAAAGGAAARATDEAPPRPAVSAEAQSRGAEPTATGKNVNQGSQYAGAGSVKQRQQAPQQPREKSSRRSEEPSGASLRRGGQTGEKAVEKAADQPAQNLTSNSLRMSGDGAVTDSSGGGAGGVGGGGGGGGPVASQRAPGPSTGAKAAGSVQAPSGSVAATARSKRAAPDAPPSSGRHSGPPAKLPRSDPHLPRPGQPHGQDRRSAGLGEPTTAPPAGANGRTGAAFPPPASGKPTHRASSGTPVGRTDAGPGAADVPGPPANVAAPGLPAGPSPPPGRVGRPGEGDVAAAGSYKGPVIAGSRGSKDGAGDKVVYGPPHAGHLLDAGCAGGGTGGGGDGAAATTTTEPKTDSETRTSRVVECYFEFDNQFRVAGVSASISGLGSSGSLQGGGHGLVARLGHGRFLAGAAAVAAAVPLPRSGGATAVPQLLDLGKIRSFKDLRTQLEVLYDGTLPDELDSKIIYLDEEGDWIMVTPDEPWSSVAAAATKVLVTNRT